MSGRRGTRIPKALLPAELPPMALDVEEALLGAFLLEGTALVARLAPTLDVDDFYTEAHRIIFTTMRGLADVGQPVDIVTIADELRRRDQLEAVGGPTALAILHERAAMAVYAPDYARRLRDAGIKRALVQAAAQLHARAADGADADALVNDVEGLALTLRGRATDAATTPTVSVEGEDVRVAWRAFGLDFVLTRPREGRDGPRAELVVTLAGVVLHWGDLPLASTQAREGVVKKLDQERPGLPWRAMLEAAVWQTVTELRRGSPDVILVPTPRSVDRVLLEGFLTVGEPVVLYGDGGTGKGYMGLLIALALTTGQHISHLRPARGGIRVGYLDWEADHDEQEARMDQLERGTGLRFPPGHVVYRRMLRPLADDLPAVRALVARHRLDVLLIDSAALAAGTELEGSDAPMRVYGALRALEVTPLILGHVAKAAADTASATIYGSTFWKNLARSTWELRRSQATTDVDPNTLVVAAFHRKANNGPLQPPWSLRFTFAPDGAVAVQDADLRDAPDLLQSASIGRRIVSALRDGAQTSAELAERLSAPFDSVDRTARRLRTKGALIALPDTRPTKWGLPA